MTNDYDVVLLKGAMRKAHGRDYCRARQVMLKGLNDAAGWASYCAKDLRRTGKALPGKRVVYLSQPMTRDRESPFREASDRR